MRKIRRIVMTLLLLGAAWCFTGCGAKESAPEETEDKVVIGVCAYNTDFEEMQLFMDYYRNYIAQGMSVDFLFSETLTSGDAEREFIKMAKEQGAEGIISFYGQDIQNTLKLCEEEQIYYVLGSGSISDEDFASAEDNPYFLGAIGPNTEEEYQAGYDMIVSFAAQGADSYLLITGGASAANYMHISRTKGMLDALAATKGVTFSMSADEAAALTEVTELETGDDSVHVTICPGYISSGENAENLENALQVRDYDAAASVMSFGSTLDLIIEASASWGHTVLTGTVDCFSEANLSAVQAKDAYGEMKLNYVAGKYASLAGPAVAAVYNAVTGHPEAVLADGKPFRLSQALWKADTAEEYKELYDFTQGVYENAYSCDELMNVIAVFHPDTTYEDFAALTEASDVESVEERILSR